MGERHRMERCRRDCMHRPRGGASFVPSFAGIPVRFIRQN